MAGGDNWAEDDGGKGNDITSIFTTNYRSDEYSKFYVHVYNEHSVEVIAIEGEAKRFIIAVYSNRNKHGLSTKC